MEPITHIAVLVFTVVVILGVGAFVVIDMFGRVDYLKDKAPWLKKALERREALGVLLVVAIFLVIGDGYELTNKEVPAVPAAPTVEIKAPRAPDISKCEIVRALAPGVEKTPPQTQTNVPERVCPPPTVVYQSAPGSPPPTQLERLTQANKNLPKGDRDRLADALFDFAKTVDEGNGLFAKANSEGTQLTHGWRDDGSIAKSLDTHRIKLREIESAGKEFYKSLERVQEKWKYFPNQRDYVWGDNPYNLGPNSVINAAQSYISYIDRWDTIQNKDQQQVLSLFGNEQEEYERFLKIFGAWISGCQKRIDEMRKSIE
jgi:hypothetical protein